MKKNRTFIAFLMTLIMGLSGISLDGFAALSYAAEDQEAPAVTQEQGIEETEAAQPVETEAEAAEAAEEEITEDTGTEPDSDDAAAPDEAGLDGVTPDTDQEEPEEAKATNLEQTITVSDKKTFKVSVTYDEHSGIPADADLRVAEVSDKDYKTYLREAAETLDTDLHSLSYGKLFDISIVKDGKEYQPNEKVAVKINLIDKDAEAVKDVKVVHFSDSDQDKSADSELGTAEELKASTKGTTVTFKTDSFSVFSFMDFSLKNQTIDASVEGKKGTQFKNDDIIVTGKMPANGIVEANRVNAKIGKENVLVAYDIKIYANDLMKELNINWQPGEEAVKVKMTSDALNVEKVNVYHTPDGSKEAELVAKNVSVKKHSVTFDAESFSIYHVTGETTKPRIFYTFYNGSTTLATEYITKIEDFYDPGVSPQYGQTFLGWAYDPAETDEDKMLSFEQLKAALETKLDGAFEDGTEVKVYARFHEAYYLRYMVMKEDGTVGVIKSENVRTDATDKTKTVNCNYSSAGEEFEGWIDAATGTVYQNGKTLELDHHIDLYAKVEGRFWLVFNANIKGATFTGPQLIYNDFVTERPENPTKKGYLFDGWNTEPDGSGTWWYKSDGSVDRFGGTITEDTTLYAIWKGAPSNYYVVFWKQKVDATGNDPLKDYEYAESVQRNGVTGDEVQITTADTQKNYDHYVYNASITDTGIKKIEADGTTTFNVYYDLQTYTLRFFFAREYIIGTKTYFQVNNNNEYFKGHSTSIRDSLTNYVTSDIRLNYNGTNTWRNVTASDPTTLISNLLATNSSISFDPATNKETYRHSTRVYSRNNTNGTATTVDVTYYYFDLNVKYGQSISSIWPKTSSIDSTNVTQENYIDDALVNLTRPLSPQLWGTYGSNLNISGTQASVDDELLQGAVDNTVYYLLYWRQTSMDTYLYEVYFSSTNGDGTYERQDDLTYVASIGAGQSPNGIKDLSFDGVTWKRRAAVVSGSGTWQGVTYSNGIIRVYYDRNIHDITFITKDHLADGVSREEHTSENIPYGADISSYAKGGDNYYTPFGGDTTKLEDGYYFDGWFTDPDCTIPYDFTGKTMPDSGISVYAKISTYRVRTVFVPNCTDYWFANNQALSFRVDYGESVAFGNVKPGVAKRPGYKLTGWYTTPDFQEGTEINTDNPLQITQDTPGVNMEYQSTDDWRNNVYGDNDGEHDDVKGILKLYARWQLDINENAVYFLYEVEDGFCIFDASGNNQTSIPVDSNGYLFGSTVQIAEAPSGFIDGVDFLDWMVLNNNGGATSVTHGAGNTITLVESEWADFIETKTVTDVDGHVGTMHIVRLRARFTEKEGKATTIVFDGNGGSMSDGATTYTEVVPLNATVELETQSSAFTREHFSLVSWNEKADGTGESFDVDEKIYADNKDLPNKLYAIWLEDIEIVATGPEEEVIYDGEQHSNTKLYKFKYLLGGEEKTLEQIEAMGIHVTISETGWPVATGTERGVYTADDLTAEELAGLIQIDDSNYTGKRNIKRVYHPAKLTIRDLKLTMTKTVTGDFSDPKDVFHFKLQSVEGVDSSTTFKGTITHEGTTSPKTFKIGQDSTFWLRDGDSVEIEGLPKGKEVTIVENSGFYTPTWVLNDETVTGSDPDEVKVILSGDSTLEVTNNLPAVAPTAVTQRFMPYICMALLALMLLAVMVMGRRRRSWAEEG